MLKGMVAAFADMVRWEAEDVEALSSDRGACILHLLLVRPTARRSPDVRILVKV